jgi:hypothetical protein
MGCPNAYCEDCVDFESSKILAEQPPPELKNVGFTRCAQAVYITCSDACAINYDATYFTAFEYPPGCKAPEIEYVDVEDDVEDEETDGEVVYLGTA